MKAILEFELPEEEEEFDSAKEGSNLQNAIWHVLEEIRSKLKYGNLNEFEATVWEEARTLIWQTIEDRGLEKFF